MVENWKENQLSIATKMESITYLALMHSTLLQYNNISLKMGKLFSLVYNLQEMHRIYIQKYSFTAKGTYFKKLVMLVRLMTPINEQ